MGSSYTPKLDLQSLPSVTANVIRYRSVPEYHSLYLSGELTPLAVAQSLLPLIRRDLENSSNHSIAFIDCHPEAVLEAAKASTVRYKQGQPLSSKRHPAYGCRSFVYHEISRS